MHSSTSSSDARPDSRRVALRTTAAGLLLLLAGLLWSRCHIEVIDIVQPEKMRLREALQALPAVAEQPGDTLLFFGSSLVWNGFVPDTFDAQLREHGVEVASFNLGFGGLNPTVQRVLVRRIRAAYERAGRRSRLTLVEFNPFQTTQVRARSDERVADQHAMMLATSAQVARLWLTSPERAARHFASRTFRKSLSPEAVTSAVGAIVAEVGKGLGPAPTERPSPEEQLRLDRRQQAAIDVAVGLARAYRGIPTMWELEVRGGTRMDFPEIHDALEVLLAPIDWDQRDDLAMRVRCCDIEQLRFAPELGDDFIALVDEFSAISDRVEVVLMPVNHAWVERTPEARVRMRDVVARIERETGVPVADFQSSPKLDPEMFWDVTHLGFITGAPVFSAHLADHYAPMLSAALAASTASGPGD